MQELIFKGQATVFQLVSDDVAQMFHDLANSITQEKRDDNKSLLDLNNWVKKIKYDAVVKLAHSLLTGKVVVYKNNFIVEQSVAIEFADSRIVTKKSNKGVRRNSNNHSANKRGSN